MYRIVLFLTILFLLFSCKEKKKEKRKMDTQNTEYSINGFVFDKEQKIIYLKLLINNQLITKDSTRIQDSRFQFSGNIPHPYKALLQLEDYENAFTFILGIDSCIIELNTSQMQSSIIKESKINDELKIIQRRSGAIYRKIDYLFPKLQKARMENDFETLEKINIEINSIIAENQEYLYNYIHDHPNESLSGLLLNDLWLTPNKDSIQLQRLAKTLTLDTQKILNFSIH
jgi:hypothetical protein